nr:radical SAM protein [Spirochaetota bacterium]
NFCDTAIVGEAESAWKHFLEDLKKGNPKKIYFQQDYGEVDITKLPIPRYDLLKDKGYSTIWINTSRGCPYDCEFCSVTNLFGKKYRHKSVEQIVKEIEYVKKVFNKIYVGFGDDNMFVDRDFSNRLMEKFGELNFRWVCQSDISIGKDIEFLKKLYKAGCHVIFIGFESLDEENLSNIYEKSRKLKRDYYSQYSEMIANIQGSGLGILGSFIIGLDNDTKESISGIADFVEKTNMLTATLNVLTPLPGTRLRKRLENENRIIPTSWENYTFWDINFIPRSLTYRELDEGMIKTLEKIYSLERTKKVTDYYKEIYKNLMENEIL